MCLRQRMELNGALSNPQPNVGGSYVELLVELNGALSNAQATLESSLRRLLDLSRDILQKPPGRVLHDIRPRPARVQAAVDAVVRSASLPIRVRDVCQAIEQLGIGPFDKASVRKTLHEGTRGTEPRFRRIAWGLYEPAERRLPIVPTEVSLEKSRPAVSKTACAGSVTSGALFVGQPVTEHICHFQVALRPFAGQDFHRW